MARYDITLPQLADRWLTPNKPSLGAADLFNIPIQKFTWSKVNPSSSGFIHIRFAPDYTTVFKLDDIWEAPQGSGDYYRVYGLWKVHEGFPNEYWSCAVFLCTAAGVQKNQSLP